MLHDMNAHNVVCKLEMVSPTGLGECSIRFRVPQETLSKIRSAALLTVEDVFRYTKQAFELSVS